MKYTVLSNVLSGATCTTAFFVLILSVGFVVPERVLAQSGEQMIRSTSTEEGQNATTSTTSEYTRYASSTLAAILGDYANPGDKKDLTQPEQFPEKLAIVELFASRPIESPTIFNFLGYWVQQSVLLGIPANTIVLILLIPILAMFVTFVRVILGLPTLELLVPIALVYAFVAVGVVLGLIILAAIILASYASRFVLKRVPIMYFPKRSISLFLLAFFVFIALTVTAAIDSEMVRTLSIFPVLILTLLGDSIVSVQLYKSFIETFVITSTTICIGLVGFLLATAPVFQRLIVLYPEVVLLTLPLNILMGRYFGLRFFELFRFNAMRSYGSE
jgi:hypothetical protein